jgi:uncharacterized protein (TIGR02271 family)
MEDRMAKVTPPQPQDAGNCRPGPEKIPVVQEHAEVGKRTVETGRVRVSKQITEQEERIDQPLLREEVEVRRVPIGRPVQTMPEPRQEGETMIIPVVEEVLIRQLVLKEEVHITRRRKEEHHPESVMLRKEEIVIDRTNSGQKGETGPALANLD